MHLQALEFPKFDRQRQICQFQHEYANAISGRKKEREQCKYVCTTTRGKGEGQSKQGGEREMEWSFDSARFDNS